jgi:hypothetical protein
MSTVQIACVFPGGLILESADGATKVKLAGPNARPCTGAYINVEQYGVTPVDETFWHAWLAAHPDLPMLAQRHVYALGS